MQYVKLLFSSILAMIIAVAVIWFSLIVLIFSAILTPLVSWWSARKPDITSVNIPPTENNKKENTEYKIIEAEYEIIDKKD